MAESNYKLARFYVTSNTLTDDEPRDFRFTQMEIDDRIQRIEDIIVEVEANVDEVIEEAEKEEKISFHGNGSNMNSS